MDRRRYVGAIAVLLSLHYVGILDACPNLLNILASWSRMS